MSPLSVILLSSVKKAPGLNQDRNLHNSSTVYKQKQSRTALQQFPFSLEEALLWIMDSYLAGSNGLKLKNILIELFLTNTQLFTSQDIN